MPRQISPTKTNIPPPSNDFLKDFYGSKQLKSRPKTLFSAFLSFFSSKICMVQKNNVPLQRKNTDGAIAQLVEQRTENPCVPGSIPGGTTKSESCIPQLSFAFSSLLILFYIYVLRKNQLQPGQTNREYPSYILYPYSIHYRSRYLRLYTRLYSASGTGKYNG